MASTGNRGGWFSSSKSETKENSSFYNTVQTYVPDLDPETFATSQVAIGFMLGSLSTVGVVALHNRYLRRIPTSDWVHPRFIAKRKWIKGVVTSVGDGDGFRLYHTPGPFWRWPLKLRKVPLQTKDLKDETIHIRLAGVDAPEAAHFGKQAQPYAREALAWLKNEVEGRRLWVQLIRRDQYGRIVAIPVHPPRISFMPAPASRCVSIAMLRAGYATTYEQSGAEYGRWGKEKFLQYEEAARTAKRGMWASTTTLESPADYKKRYREGNITAPSADANAKGVRGNGRKKSDNWLSFLTFWR